MEIIKILIFLLISYGIGSYPLPPQGWHLIILLNVIINPLKGPCFIIDSFEYCEHVGLNLHLAGIKGEIKF
tara:strand:- start:108 stop:320 length:213 start_codon:yes stop_codon:yes gene_type:complete